MKKKKVERLIRKIAKQRKKNFEASYKISDWGNWHKILSAVDIELLKNEN